MPPYPTGPELRRGYVGVWMILLHCPHSASPRLQLFWRTEEERDVCVVCVCVCERLCGKEKRQDSIASVPCCQRRQLVSCIDGGMTAGARGAGSMPCPRAGQACFMSMAQCHLEVSKGLLLFTPTQPQTLRCTLVPEAELGSHQPLCRRVGWCAPGVKVKN